MVQIVALRDPDNPRRMAELETFEDSPEGAKKAQEAASRIIDEYGDAGDMYMESADSVERFLQLKQATETLKELESE